MSEEVQAQATLPTTEGSFVTVDSVTPGTVNIPAGIVPTAEGQQYPIAVGETDQSGVEKLMDDSSKE